MDKKYYLVIYVRSEIYYTMGGILLQRLYNCRNITQRRRNVYRCLQMGGFYDIYDNFVTGTDLQYLYICVSVLVILSVIVLTINGNTNVVVVILTCIGVVDHFKWTFIY